MSNRQAWNSKTGTDVKPRNIIAVRVQIRTPMPERMGGLGLWVLLQAGSQWISPTHRTHLMRWVLPVNNCLSEQMDRVSWVSCLALLLPHIPSGCFLKREQ